jgi:hypothetical protein
MQESYEEDRANHPAPCIKAIPRRNSWNGRCFCYELTRLEIILPPGAIPWLRNSDHKVASAARLSIGEQTATATATAASQGGRSGRGLKLCARYAARCT